MYRRKIDGNQPVCPIYSDYSNYCGIRCAFTLPCSEHQKPFQTEKNIRTIITEKISEALHSLSCLIFFVLDFLNQIFKYKQIVNKFFLNFNYCRCVTSNSHYNICYIMTQNVINSDCNMPEEEHRAYKVVQILKKNIMEESQDSEGSNQPNAMEHIKTKKSLFASLIKRKNLRRPKVKITKKIETCSTINIETESVSSEQELAQYHVSAKSEHFYPPKLDLEAPSKAKHYNFFQKIIKRSKSDNPTAKNFKDYEEQSKENEHGKGDQRILAHLSHFVPTTYMPKYNVKLINGINELQDILQNLHHCEEHMIYLLKKYIEDSDFRKQLMQTSFDYFALQYDAKCHTDALANGMWVQQLDMSKIQEYNFQKKLNCLVKTNRALQFQVENLSRQCEKLADRTNLYPKRFLHMRSFNKSHARNLIDNNRKLQNKLKALTGVIADFEDEMQKLQHQKGVLEEEKRDFKSQIYHLEGILDRQVADYELEKAALTSRLSKQSRLISDSEQTSRFLLQDLIGFEHQARELAITVNWPSFQHQEACLPELIYQIRTCVGELFATLISTYTEVTAIAKDVNKLRNTNARLQENLQKSTNELDNLSKKLEKNAKEVDGSGWEILCNNLQQENYGLKMKLDSSLEQNKTVQDELKSKEKLLNESNATINEISAQNFSTSNQIEEVLQAVAQNGRGELAKEFRTNQDKLEYFRLRHTQVITDCKHLTDRCNSLEEENQNLLQNQQMYQQDLNTLQEGINILNAENEIIKKQLATEHQTVTSLQNERIKYLEEKNILKTIFQHLKSEISRVQQLEDAVADMNKETSRLTLVAEFNKQLGEQLKNEVEVKENTILELRQSLEKLSHIQIDNDKEKMTLCAQLSEISSVKDKLTDCLEMELQKNMHLDESKKKLECTTKSQLKIYEEMQRSERAALKELLRDFKSLIKQRDCLVHLQEQNKKKQQELEKHINELRKQHDNALAQVNERDEDIRKLTEKLEEQEDQFKKMEEDHHVNATKYEKTIRKLEKLLGQIRNEKGELETSNTYLKNTLQKVQNDLNEARQKETGALNTLSVKSAENATLETELDTYKNNLQMINQENGKLKLEMEYLSKMYEKQGEELNKMLLQFSSKDNMYLESHTAMVSKEQEIIQLNRTIFERDSKIQQLEHEYNYLKKQNEDQNRIMCGYENQLVILQDVEAAKLKMEKELRNVELEHESTQMELDAAKKEIENLNKELRVQIIKFESEKSFYKNQTHDLIFEYNEQKVNIEDEIDSISSQLHKVTDDLHYEKLRFDELSQAHEDLKAKFLQIKESLSAEVGAHQETCRKLEDTDNVMKALGQERDNLQQQVHLLLLEINEEKESNLHLSSENKKVQIILEQGRQQYGILLEKNTSLEEEVKELRYEMQTLLNSKEISEHEITQTMMKVEEKTAELKNAKETIECLKEELTESQKILFDLKEEFFNLQKQVTGLEFKNCELTLQIHETQGKLETERNLYKELKDLKNEHSPVVPSDCGELFY